MSKVKLYIASSVDGYIARENGSVDWLDNFPNPEKIDYGYNEFLHNVDILLMGRNTYEEILGFDIPWPYVDQKTFVVSSNDALTIKSENTFGLQKPDHAFIDQVKKESDKGIWVVGGGKLLRYLLDQGLIDEIQLFIMPIILGRGIPLFPYKTIESSMVLIRSEAYYNGIVHLHYRMEK